MQDVFMVRLSSAGQSAFKQSVQLDGLEHRSKEHK